MYFALFHGQVLLGDTTKPQDSISFICKGECSVVREIYLKKTRELKLSGSSYPVGTHKAPVTVCFCSATPYTVGLIAGG